MVKITNGIDTFEVSRGAYEGIFSKQGYSLVDVPEVNKAAEEAEDPVEVDDKSEDEMFCDSLVEKPIAQWTKNEAKRFAEIKGIDTSDGPTATKELIKEFLNA